MKLTREMLHYFIDAQPPHNSAEEILINMVCCTLHRCPQMLPMLMEELGNNLSAMFEKCLHTFYVCNERASWLESYLDGRMYPEEIAKQQEYIDIQKGHAIKIKETCKDVMQWK